MPEQCEECREEKEYKDVINLNCELGYEHSICIDCIKAMKNKVQKVKSNKRKL